MAVIIIDLHNKVRTQRTIMDVTTEMGFIDEILQLEKEDIVNNQDLFFDILEVIETSHTQTIFEVNNQNIDIYKGFAKWVREWKGEFLNKETLLENIAVNLESTF